MPTKDLRVACTPRDRAMIETIAAKLHEQHGVTFSFADVVRNSLRRTAAALDIDISRLPTE